MENPLQIFIHMTTQANGKAGLVASILSCFASVFAFIKTFKDFQPIVAMFASCVAIVSGGFAIYYYHLQIKKLKQNG